jgi:uncharacterized protein with ParB-like and HNH nuclease domain
MRRNATCHVVPLGGFGEQMKISTILDHIEYGHLALPEFQRGYVWGRDQVRGLFSSLYRRYPVGSFLVWTTEADSVMTRGAGPQAGAVIKLLLDGQQTGDVPIRRDARCTSRLLSG